MPFGRYIVQDGQYSGPKTAIPHPMARLRLFLLAFFMLASCAKVPGFKAENFEYRMATPPASTQTDEKKEEPKKPGTVVRSAKRIDMTLSKTEWQDGTKKLNLKANVQLDGKPLGEVEFEGTRQDSKIVLNPKNPDLQDKLKAQMYCLSEESTCTDFFIDVFYREKDVLYHDQVLSEPKKDDSKTPDAGSKPSQGNTPAQAPKKHEDDEPFAFIDPDATRNSGFAGSSDAEAWELYGLKVPPGSEAVPDSSTDGKKGEPPPVAQPLPTPAPVPGGTKKGDDGGKIPSPQPAPTPNQPPPSVTPPIGKDNSNGKDGNKPPKDNPQEPTQSGPMRALELKFKSSDQAINMPFFDPKRKVNGHLDHGINFRDIPKAIPDIGFQVVANDTTTYGSYGLATVLVSMAQSLHDILPGRVLYVTSVSKQGGGPVDPHDSHQNGTDIDIRYLRNNESGPSDIVNGNTISSNFMVKQQWELMKKTFQTNKVQIVFMDRVVKKALCDYAISIHDYKRGDDSSPGAEILRRIQHVDGHENHFHVRTQCIKGQDPRCWPVIYDFTKVPVGC